MLGWLYQTGHGVAADAAQAAKWYGLSCDAGAQQACVSFALMQAHGQGVTKDQAAALELLDKGCAAAMPQACTQEARAARIAAEGRGSHADPHAAGRRMQRRRHARVRHVEVDAGEIVALDIAIEGEAAWLS